ncbi:MAG: peptide chain release factor N(5)-glutamine methyltransferase [Anaerovoracaceae bacterium]
MSLPVKELIKIGENQLADAGVEDAAIDARELFCYMMHFDRARLMMRWQDVMQDNQCEEYFDLVARRASRVPLQHITGEQEFMGLTFQVSDKVLIPRQDTETLVEDALDVINKNKLRGETLNCRARKNWAVLDLCCGSGAIGISIAKLAEGCKVTCSDISGDALAIAEKNAANLGEKSVKMVKSDMFEAFRGKLGNKKFDLIISNPPYIRSDVIPGLQPEVKDHEPLSALDGGEDGLMFYRIIADQAPEFMKKEGILMMEIGHDQMGEVTKLFSADGRYSYVTGLKDLAGRDRIVAAILSPKKK